MFEIFKKILGLPTEAEKLAAKNAGQAPYKIEPPVVNNKTGDLVDVVPKTRKPRKPKVVAENKKAAETKSIPAAKKTRKPRSTKI